MRIIGIDNGVTGSIAVQVSLSEYYFYAMPVKTGQSYTKAKQAVTRIDHTQLLANLADWSGDAAAIMERPMINPLRFKASISAARALESVLVVLERLMIPVTFIDSKEWQRAMLPSNMGKIVTTPSGKEKRVIETAELKKASLDLACRYYPKCEEAIRKHKDGDSLLMARYFSAKMLGKEF